MKKASENIALLRLIKPRLIVFILFTYSLGVSVGSYLGGHIDLPILLVGLILCFLIWEMGSFLDAYFDHPESYYSTLLVNDPRREELLNIRRPLLFYYSLLILTAGATLTTVLLIRGALSASSGLVLGIAVLLIFFTAVPPLRLSQKGYTELVEALFITNLIPMIAFSLTGLPFSILILELMLPLILIYMAMKIALAFISHGSDLVNGRRSLTIRLGWQNALVLHNILILIAFLLVGVFLLIGLAWHLVWPLLLALLVGILQILNLLSIANGAKPKWVLVRWLAVGLFLLMVYLEIISLLI